MSLVHARHGVQVGIVSEQFAPPLEMRPPNGLDRRSLSLARRYNPALTLAVEDRSPGIKDTH